MRSRVRRPAAPALPSPETLTDAADAMRAHGLFTETGDGGRSADAIEHQVFATVLHNLGTHDYVRAHYWDLPALIDTLAPHRDLTRTPHGDKNTAAALLNAIEAPYLDRVDLDTLRALADTPCMQHERAATSAEHDLWKHLPPTVAGTPLYRAVRPVVTVPTSKNALDRFGDASCGFLEYPNHAVATSVDPKVSISAFGGHRSDADTILIRIENAQTGLVIRNHANEYEVRLPPGIRLRHGRRGYARLTFSNGLRWVTEITATIEPVTP